MGAANLGSKFTAKRYPPPKQNGISTQQMHPQILPKSHSYFYGTLNSSSRILFMVYAMTVLPPMQWVPAVYPQRLKRPGREADKSPESSSGFKN
jgi:hypothetical protein